MSKRMVNDAVPGKARTPAKKPSLKRASALLPKTATKARSYVRLRKTLATGAPQSTIALIRKGVNASLLLDLADHLGMSRARVYAMTGLPSATAERKIREDAVLSPEITERIARIAKVETEALSVFGKDDRVRQWLCTPSPIFEGDAPMDWIDTDIGTQEILKSIAAIRYGGVA